MAVQNEGNLFERRLADKPMETGARPGSYAIGQVRRPVNREAAMLRADAIVAAMAMMAADRALKSSLVGHSTLGDAVRALVRMGELAELEEWGVQYFVNERSRAALALSLLG